MSRCGGQAPYRQDRGVCSAAGRQKISFWRRRTICGSYRAALGKFRYGACRSVRQSAYFHERKCPRPPRLFSLLAMTESPDYAKAAPTEPNHHKNHRDGTSGRLGDESDGVGEVVEEDGLTVAVDVRGDDSEAIEVGAGCLVAGLQEHCSGLAVEHDEDRAQAAVGIGVVTQRPVVR